MKTEKENWFKPFSDFTYSPDKKTFYTNQPFNAVSGNNYSGFNVFELALSSLLYTTNAWVTFKQAKQLGNKDPKLKKIILEFRDDELEHHDIGIEHEAEKTPGYNILSKVIKIGCKTAIEISKKI